MQRSIFRVHPQEIEGVGEFSDPQVNMSGFVGLFSLFFSIKTSKAVGLVPVHS